MRALRRAKCVPVQQTWRPAHAAGGGRALYGTGFSGEDEADPAEFFEPFCVGQMLTHTRSIHSILIRIVLEP